VNINDAHQFTKAVEDIIAGWRVIQKLCFQALDDVVQKGIEKGICGCQEPPHVRPDQVRRNDCENLQQSIFYIKLADDGANILHCEARHNVKWSAIEVQTWLYSPIILPIQGWTLNLLGLLHWLSTSLTWLYALTARQTSWSSLRTYQKLRLFILHSRYLAPRNEVQSQLVRRLRRRDHLSSRWLISLKRKCL